MMGRCEEEEEDDVKRGALPNLANVFQGNRQGGRTPLGTRDAGGDISFLIRKGQDRLFSFSSSFSHLTRLIRPDSLRSLPPLRSTRNSSVVRSGETFGGFFSPTTREVSVYTLCVLLVAEEGREGDGEERERDVWKR